MTLFRLRHLLVGLFACTIAAGVTSQSAASPKTEPLSIDTLETSAGQPFWERYLDVFVTPEGRVIDTANGGISHSEGQGYGLILATAANDRETFDRIWNWTQQELQVRERDPLFAWRWEEGSNPNVTDPNNATDGDLLIAFALLKAHDRFGDDRYRAAARKIADAILRLTLIERAEGPTILPGIAGFSNDDRRDGPVINPSYWVFPALDRLAQAFGGRWPKVELSGLRYLQAGRFSETQLPPEWLALGGRTPMPAAGFDPVFGYNAIRVPLYLVWGSRVDKQLLEPFLREWPQGGASAPVVRHLMSGHAVKPLSAPGYRAVAALTACAVDGALIPEDLRTISIDHYYPTTLHAFALMVAGGRHPECLS